MTENKCDDTSMKAAAPIQKDICDEEMGNNKRTDPERREGTHGRRQRRSKDGSKIKTLVIGSDDVCRERVGIVLEDFCDCEFADSGLKGAEIFKSNINADEPFEFITIDAEMSETDLYEALAAIREYEVTYRIDSFDYVRVIVISSPEQSKNIIHAFRVGMEACVIKPIGDNLLGTMSELGLLRLQKQYSIA